MSFVSPLISATIAVSLGLAAMATAQEAKLAPFNPTSPALQGFLGVPGCGNFLGGGVVWHRSGRIISLESWKSGISPVSLWQPDAKTMRANRVSLLNVGDAWCLSQKGDLLCARSRRMDDSPALNPAKNSAAWAAGAFGCFRIQGGERLWKLPMRDGEEINGAVFTPDDQKVAVLSTWTEQLSLRLLDASSGTLLHQYDFPGRMNTLSFYATRLMIHGNELWMSHRKDEKQVLLRFPLTTLQPTLVDCPPLEDLPGLARLSPDARRLVSHNEFGLTCLEFRNGKWITAFEDSDFRYSAESEFGKLRDVEFTPDGQRLVIITTDSARVVDLTSKKAHMTKLDTNSGGTLSPDGSHLLVKHHHGLRIISLRETDATSPARYQQNLWRPHALRFLADGKTLFASDVEGIWVWDLATRMPRAWLRSLGQHEPVESTFRTLSLIANETEVLSEENDDVLRWKLPPITAPVPGKAEIIPPTLAFGGVRQGWSGAYPGVFVNPDATRIISVNGRTQGLLHPALGAGAARSIPGTFPSVEASQWFFGQDGALILHDTMTRQWTRLNPQQNTLEDLPDTPGIPDPVKPGRFVHPQPVGVLPKRQFVVREHKDRLCVTSLDGKTQLPWFEMPPRHFLFIPNQSASVSADEKRCACLLNEFLSGRHHVFVWEIETGRLLGYAPLPTSDGNCVALSHDGSLLACGHEHTAISLWEVAKLTKLEASAPAPASAISTPTASPAAPPPSQAAAPSQPSSSRREHALGSGVWNFLDNGAVSKKDIFPEAGRLRINGKEFKMKARRLGHPAHLTRLFHAQEDFQSEVNADRADPKFRPLQQSQFPEIAAGLIHLCEGSADDVWISRQTGNPAASSRQFLTLTDTLTNLTGKEKQVEIEFEVTFPALTQKLVDSTFTPVETDAAGMVTTRPEAVWVAALPAPGASRSVPLFWFRSLSGSPAFRLQWKPETHTLIAHYSVLLPAGEPRHVAHGLRVASLPEGAAPERFVPPQLDDFGSYMTFSARPRGINFQAPESDESTLVGRSVREASLTNDAVGQHWLRNADGSLHNSTGISSAHQLWFDGAPLPGSSLGLFIYQTHREYRLTAQGNRLFHGTSLDQKVTVMRNIGSPSEQQIPVVMDYLINQHTEPAPARLTYVTTLSENVKAVYDAKGRPVEPSGTPRPARDFGGALILEFDGPERPATLLAFYQEGATAEPQVSWPGPKLLKLEYDVTMPPRKSACFWHGATQRPLASFSSVMEAFTGCLPMQRSADAKDSSTYMNIR